MKDALSLAPLRELANCSAGGDMKIAMRIWTKSVRPWCYIGPAAKRFPGQPDAPQSAHRSPTVRGGG